MRFAILSALLFGCSIDTSHAVNVGPSAHDQLPVIADAVGRMNEMAGADVYSVRAVDSGDMRDGEIVVRCGEPAAGKRAHTHRTNRGIIIVLKPTVSDLDVAHELGHAAGLGHASERGNLMFRYADEIGWELTTEQVDAIR